MIIWISYLQIELSNYNKQWLPSAPVLLKMITVYHWAESVFKSARIHFLRKNPIKIGLYMGKNWELVQISWEKNIKIGLYMGVNGSWSLLDHLYLGNKKSCNKSGISLQTGTFLRNSIAKKKYHTVGTVPKSNRKP